MNERTKSERLPVIYQITVEDAGEKIFADLSIVQPRSGFPLILYTNGTGQTDFNDFNRFVAAGFERSGFGSCFKRVRRTSSNNARKPGSYSFEVTGKILLSSIAFLKQQRELADVMYCLFGTGDGAAAALYAAATDPADISAIVLSGARPGPALSHAPKNTIPSLFIMGSQDRIGDTAIKAAHGASRGPKELAIIPGAGHLLREPGVPEDVAQLSAGWFKKHACRH